MLRFALQKECADSKVKAYTGILLYSYNSRSSYGIGITCMYNEQVGSIHAGAMSAPPKNLNESL